MWEKTYFDAREIYGADGSQHQLSHVPPQPTSRFQRQANNNYLNSNNYQLVNNNNINPLVPLNANNNSNSNYQNKRTQNAPLGQIHATETATAAVNDPAGLVLNPPASSSTGAGASDPQ